jgi:hypothetical protein
MDEITETTTVMSNLYKQFHKAKDLEVALHTWQTPPETLNTLHVKVGNLEIISEGPGVCPSKITIDGVALAVKEITLHGTAGGPWEATITFYPGLCKESMITAQTSRLAAGLPPITGVEYK